MIEVLQYLETTISLLQAKGEKQMKAKECNKETFHSE